MTDELRAFYEANPLMVSSPFGGVDGLDVALLRKVFAALRIEVAGKDVLDVGCGRGYAGELVRAAGGRYTGVDFVVSRGGFHLVQADAARLPFGDAQFDAVFCIDAFEHFPDLARAAREFRRILRPDGFFFLSAPNYANVAGLVKRAYEGLGWYAPDTWAPFRRWQPQELEQPLTPRLLRRLTRRAGFRRSRCIGHGPEVGLGLCPWIDHPRTPEAIQFRLQRVFRTVGPPVAKLWPGSSLHCFWKFDV